jgi:predicted secreted hydrolase
VRVFAVLLATAALAAGAGAGTSTLRFPRDHYGHRAGVEWWYVTAYGRGSDGHRYSVFFTLFKRGVFVLPVSQVVNLDTGALVGHTEVALPARVGATGLDLRLPVARLSYTSNADTWHFYAARPSYSLALTARPEKPYVPHGGGTGVIQQGTAVSSYYSATRMAASGTITNEVRSIGFTGTAWLDHQWGSFTTDPSALHWDWFSCRFDDRTELMLYRFRDGHTNGTFVDAAGHGRLVTRFDAAPGPRVLNAAGRRWPLDWTLRVPSEHLTLALHAIVPDQLVRGILLPTFWEGAVTATGTKRGVCFVEETN